jgi:hypothetical protein
MIENTVAPQSNFFRALKLIYFAPQRNILSALVADVAELADALDSKSSIFTDVWVRPPPSAPNQK